VEVVRSSQQPIRGGRIMGARVPTTHEC